MHGKKANVPGIGPNMHECERSQRCHLRSTGASGTVYTPKTVWRLFSYTACLELLRTFERGTQTNCSQPSTLLLHATRKNTT
eukprot:26276-Eustigmatos_ZCMA.PRE.1